MAGWIRALAIITSLSGAIAGCQTADMTASEPVSREDEIKATQVTLVENEIDKGKPDKALLMLRQLLAERPNDPTLYNLRGLAQLALKQAVPAIKSFRRAIELDPKPTHYTLNLASAHIEAGDYNKSVAILEGLIKRPETGTYLKKERIFHNIGYAYDRMGRIPAAERWYRRATEENPSHFPSHLGLARLFERTKRPAMARTSYLQAADYCATCFEPIEPLVKLYVQAKQPKEASRILVRFIKTQGITKQHKERAERLLGLLSREGLSARYIPTQNQAATETIE